MVLKPVNGYTAGTQETADLRKQGHFRKRYVTPKKRATCYFLPCLGKDRAMDQERYYISNKQYIPCESDRLCVYECELLRPFYSRQVLYRTRRGSFFLVRYGLEMETSVSVLTEQQAFEFMDRHTAGIDTEAYDKVFGTPEKA